MALIGLQFPRGSLFYDPRSNQRVPLAQLTFTQPVYQDGALSTPWTQPIVADANGNFPPNIYLSPFVNSGQIGVTLSQPASLGGATIWTVSTYNIPFPLTADSATIQGAITLPAPATAVPTLTLQNLPGSVALRLVGSSSAGSLIAPVWFVLNNGSGAQTATFTATNKPGVQASAVTKWLPITINGAVGYIPCFS